MLDNIFKDYNILEKNRSKNFTYYKVVINYKIYFIKTINNNIEDSKNLLQNEIEKYKILSDLHNIPKIIKSELRNYWYIIYENIDGTTLEQCQKKTYNEKIKMLINLCEILEKFHERKVAHCDIKPNNIMIDKKGNLFLIDLGSCTTFGETCLYGSYKYCSLEQLSKNKVNQNFDIYSLGILMYELLVGYNPFINISKEEINESKNKNILLLNNKITISESCQRIIYKATTNNNDKYINVKEMKIDLIDILKNTNQPK